MTGQREKEMLLMKVSQEESFNDSSSALDDDEPIYDYTVKSTQVLRRVMKKTPSNTPSPSKNTSITPRGTRFTWADNNHIKHKNPFKLNQPANISLRLIDTNGIEHEFQYPHQTRQWDSPKWLVKVNSWYNQLIARKLNHQNPTKYRAGRYRRPGWSVMEKEYLETLIAQRIRLTRSRLATSDWDALAKIQNDHFAGQIVRKGQAYTLNNSRGRTTGAAKKHRLASKDKVIPTRTGSVLSDIISKWEDTQKLIADLLEEVGYCASPQDEDEPNCDLDLNDGDDEEDYADDEDEDFDDGTVLDGVPGLKRKRPGDGEGSDEEMVGMDNAGVSIHRQAFFAPVAFPSSFV